MVNAIGYARISSVGQRTVDGSLSHQNRIIEGMCHDRAWNLLEICTDDGRSGRSIKGRPDFQRALALVDEKLSAGDHFVVATGSRFGRNAAELIPLSRQLFDRGIILSTPEGDFDGENYVREFEWYDLQLQAAKESRRNSHETRRNMRAHAMNGRYQAKAPFGYRNLRGVPGRSLVIVEDEAEVVRWLFGAYADGVELSGLAALLTASDVFARQKPRLARPGAQTQRINWVRDTLLRPVYKGVLNERRTDYIDVLGDWEPIVSADLFAQAQDRLSGKRGVGRKRRLEEFPLKGVLICESCGRPLTASASKGRNGKLYSYYHCPTSSCMDARIAVEEAHGHFELLLKTLAVPEDLEDELVNRLKIRAAAYLEGMTQRRKAAQAHLENARELEDRATDAFLAGDIDRTEKDGAILRAREGARAQEEILALLPKLGEDFVECAVEKGRALCSKPLSTWQSPPKSQRWRFARGFFPYGIAASKAQVRNGDSLAMSTLLGAEDKESPLWHPQRDSNPCRHLERVAAFERATYHNY
jgi:site-specific DNA recombinase